MKPQTSGRVALAAIASVLLGACIGHVMAKRRSLSEATTVVSPASVLVMDAAPAPMAPEPTAPQAGLAAAHQVAASETGDYAASFRRATNYRQFILEALPAATAGDRDAQYYISAAIAYCDENLRFFFKPRGKTLSFEEAIAVQTSRGSYSYIEGIHRTHGRCHDFGDSGTSWGTQEQWLARATMAGQPEAQAATAMEVLSQSFAPARRSPVRKFAEPDSSETYSLEDGRELAGFAAASKSPEALFMLGDLLPFFAPDLSYEETQRQMLTWRFVACLRGLDCSAGSEWHKQLCLNDAPCPLGESGVDYLIRTASQIGMGDLDPRAAVLNDKIEQGDWKGLGLEG